MKLLVFAAVALFSGLSYADVANNNMACGHFFKDGDGFTNPKPWAERGRPYIQYENNAYYLKVPIIDSTGNANGDDGGLMTPAGQESKGGTSYDVYTTDHYRIVAAEANGQKIYNATIYANDKAGFIASCPEM